MRVVRPERVYVPGGAKPADQQMHPLFASALPCSALSTLSSSPALLYSAHYFTGLTVLEAAAASAQSAASTAGPHSKKKRRVDAAAAADDAAAGGANNAAAAGAHGLEVARSLTGHLHCVAAVAWPAQGVVFTGGWDHSVRRCVARRVRG